MYGVGFLKPHGELWRIMANVFMANYDECFYGKLWRIVANVFMANCGECFYGVLGPTQLRNSP